MEVKAQGMSTEEQQPPMGMSPWHPTQMKGQAKKGVTAGADTE